MWGAVYSLARMLLPLLFVIEGLLKFVNINGIVRVLEASSLPIPGALDLLGISRFALIGYLVALIEVVCGVMVIVGYRTRTAGLILVAFAAATIIVVHPFWTMEGKVQALNLTQALKNLSIAAGLLMIAALGPGRYAFDTRRR